MNTRLFSLSGLGVMACGLWLAACSSDSSAPSGVGGGGAGGSAGHAGGSAGAVSGGGGSAGTSAQAGSGGSSAGEGGTSGGSAGGSAGTSSGGSAGASAGSGGNAGVGGSAGSGGNVGNNAGSGGSSAGNGGSAGVAGTGGNASAGSAGTGGSGSAPCGGCAVLSAPFTATNQQMTGQVGLNPTDLSNVTLTVRACVVAGDASSALHVYFQDGAAQGYAGDYGVLFKTLDGVKKCTDGMQDLTLAVASAGTFDATVVTALNVQLVTTGTGPFSSATVYIDSITATGDAVGPWTFTSNASALGLQGGGADGATLTWLK